MADSELGASAKKCRRRVRGSEEEVGGRKFGYDWCCQWCRGKNRRTGPATKNVGDADNRSVSRGFLKAKADNCAQESKSRLKSLKKAMLPSRVKIIPF